MRAAGEVWIAFTLAIVAVSLGALLSLRLADDSAKLGQNCDLVPLGQSQTISADEVGCDWNSIDLTTRGEKQPLIEARAKRESEVAKDEDAVVKKADSQQEEGAEQTAEEDQVSQEQIEKRKQELSTEQNYVCFQKGTEAPFSGKYYDNHEHGMYICVVCENPLFASDTKFDSGTGWPSFWEMAEAGHVATHEDRSHGMSRTEVTCAKCGSHLGHVFDDGPKPSGLRYCINSLSLDFIPAEDWAARQADDSKDARPQGDK